MREVPVHPGIVALIDDADYERLSQYSWYVSAKGYALSTKRVSGTKTHLRMHRLVLAVPPGMQVDHINGMRLDNRRCNLRVATHAQNLQNRGGHLRRGRKTSRFKGVCFDPKRSKWVAQIGAQGRRVPLGRFDDEEAAARAYDAAATTLHDEWARTNFESAKLP